MTDGIFRYSPLWGEWEIDNLIGRGSYGEVYKIHKTDGNETIEAAAKYISIPKADDWKEYRSYTEEEQESIFQDRADRFMIEISSMLKLKGSENVVHYENHILEPKRDTPGWDIIIRMELLKTLEDYLDEHDFSKKDVIRLGIDIAGAIADCQKEQIIHRDIKIENIFIDAVGHYKLGDFGVSTVKMGTATGTRTGTEDYMAPEITRENRYNNTVDIYSLGIVLYRLLNNRRKPFVAADMLITTDLVGR